MSRSETWESQGHTATDRYRFSRPANVVAQTSKSSAAWDTTSSATGRKREADRTNARRTSFETADAVPKEATIEPSITVDLALTGDGRACDEPCRTGARDPDENDDDA
jgi:hypothetical protein